MTTDPIFLSPAAGLRAAQERLRENERVARTRAMAFVPTVDHAPAEFSASLPRDPDTMLRIRANAIRFLKSMDASATADHAHPSGCGCGGHGAPAEDGDRRQQMTREIESLQRDVVVLRERAAAPRRATVDATARVEGGITAAERQAVAEHATAVADRALVTKVASPLAAMNRRNAEVWGGLTPLGQPRAGGSR